MSGVIPAAQREFEALGPQLAPGTRVAVQTALESWASGFVVAGHCGGRYRLVRVSDGWELPKLFAADCVVAEAEIETSRRAHPSGRRVGR